jgi:transposase
MRAQLSTYYPAAVTVWQRVGLGHPQARAVLRLAPTPYAAAQLTRAQLAIALRAGGRWRTVDDEAERLHLAFCRATLTTHPDVEAARGVELLGLLDDLDQAVGRIDALASEVARCFAEHPHQPIVRSLPGVGPILGARLLGEIGSIARFPDARALCAYAGVTPVTWGSGTVVRVRARRSANSHLRETMHQVALCALHRSAGARACYTAARQRGMDHRPALRTVATRLLRCAYHCLTRGELYEEDLAWRPTRATEDCLPAPRSPWGE